MEVKHGTLKKERWERIEIHGESNVKHRKRGKDMMLKLGLIETLDQLATASSVLEW